MEVILAAVEPPLAEAWEQFCADLEGVRVHRGSLLDLSVDAVVSPANSFGFMDGGIDRMFAAFFGPQLQVRVQDAIARRDVVPRAAADAQV